MIEVAIPGGWEDVATTTATTYTHTGLDPETEYIYRVSAVYGDDVSEPSDEAKETTEAAPPAPMLGSATGLSASAGTAPGTVMLTWTAGANSTRHYLAGVKVSDWRANDFSNVIFRAAAGNSADLVTDLISGEPPVGALSDIAAELSPGRMLAGLC